jgi:hypothetical protein
MVKQRFFGLGYKDCRASERWVQEHLQDCVFSLIVDVHLVIEHIYNAISVNDVTLKQLQSVYKLKFENLTQGLAVSSFDARIPNYFSKTCNLVTKSSKSNVSCFDSTPSYALWDEPQSGAKIPMPIVWHNRLLKTLLHGLSNEWDVWKTHA